ncbi:hypothetical protein [Synechococcus sp. MIT S9508]|uniref:hypothetical protein n=1 Tax=Synechococcus sp. MIT S9508 TaxID=1801629 RepID=UPI0007BB425A|nr:hypothetical protein [Synechococcus sp. MIT S9508]KZR91174.1 hypothetical protein MITS9508_00412 [Synechococcus sp. MIT S9508]
MKYLPILGALLLSASPAIADDLLYLRCKQSVDIVITDLITSEIVEDRTIDDISILKIDFSKKTMHDSRAGLTVNFALKNKIATIIQKVDDDEVKVDDVTKIKLSPPYLNSSTGTGIVKAKNQSSTYRAEGVCEEVDASAWNESFKQSES